MQAQPGNAGRLPPRSLSTLPASPRSLPGSPRDPSRQHQPLSTYPGPPYPLSPVLTVSCRLLEKWRRESCPIDHSERTFTTHARREPHRAPRYRSAHLFLSDSPPSYLLAPLRGLSVHLLRVYPLRDNPDAKGLLSHRQISQPGRARRALEQPTLLRGRWPHYFRDLTERVRLRGVSASLGRDAIRRVGCEPMKMQRLSGSGQSAFGLESLTPI